VLLVAIALAATMVPLAASGIGHWLVIADPLDTARAVVVLSGRVPFRAMAAAAIHRDGWAPEVWISRPARTPEELAMRRIGIMDVVVEEERNRQVLERSGVPPGAIRLLGPGVLNTMEEIELIAREARRAGADRLILVTSKTHSRRVKATWRALVGEAPAVIVRHSTEDHYDPDRWWRQTGDALDVSREVFGLMNVWAGFPVRPDRDGASVDRAGR
jgi:uncharacterized SAM-binding protein YcdF (DUF218 family)